MPLVRRMRRAASAPVKPELDGTWLKRLKLERTRQEASMETSMVPMKMSQNMGNNGLGSKLDITHGAGWNLSRVTENRQVYPVRFQAARWFRGLIEDHSFVLHFLTNNKFP